MTGAAPAPGPRSRTPVIVIVLAIALLAGGAFIWKRKATQAQCDDLLAHYAELVVREHMPDAGAAEIAAERQRERVEAKRDDAFKNCTSEVQSTEHECAMKAQTSEALIKCLE